MTSIPLFCPSIAFFSDDCVLNVAQGMRSENCQLMRFGLIVTIMNIVVATINSPPLSILPVFFVEFGRNPKFHFWLFFIVLAEFKMADYPVDNFESGHADFKN